MTPVFVPSHREESMKAAVQFAGKHAKPDIC